MGITYSTEDAQNHYRISLPAGYADMRIRIQQGQIVKAGARLAHILSNLAGLIPGGFSIDCVPHSSLN